MLKNAWELFRDTALNWHRNEASQLAAALAFYAVVSLAPTVVIVMAFVDLVFGKREGQTEIIEQVRGWFGPQAAEFLRSMMVSLNNSRSGAIATTVAILTVSWGSTRLFTYIQHALNKIWHVPSASSNRVKRLIKNRLLSFLMVLGIGLFVLIFLAASTLLTAVSRFFSPLFTIPSYLELVNFALSFVVTTVLFAVVYKILPNAKIAWGDVWVGAVATSLLFNIGKFLIGMYIALAGIGSAYGAAASLFVLLVWLYYSAQVFFFGAEFTKVYAEKYGTTIRPTVASTARGSKPRLD